MSDEYEEYAQYEDEDQEDQEGGEEQEGEGEEAGEEVDDEQPQQHYDDDEVEEFEDGIPEQYYLPGIGIIDTSAIQTMQMQTSGKEFFKEFMASMFSGFENDDRVLASDVFELDNDEAAEEDDDADENGTVVRFATTDSEGLHHELKVKLDTGAGRSFLSENIWELLQWEMEAVPEGTEPFHVGDNSEVMPIGLVKLLYQTPDDMKHYRMTFHVLEDCPRDVLIGKDIMSMFYLLGLHPGMDDFRHEKDFNLIETPPKTDKEKIAEQKKNQQRQKEKGLALLNRYQDDDE